MADASLAPIFQRLSQAEGYHPFTADTFSDWSVEAGDVVRIGRDGTTYQSPVHTSKLVWKGAPKMTLDSGGSRERDSVSRMSAKKYGRGGGGVRNNQAIFWEMFSEDGHLHSSIMATESVIRAEVADLYNQMAAGLRLTSSEAHLYVDDKYNQLASGLRLTSSEAHLYVDNKYRQLESGLKLTSSTAKLYVDDKYNQMGSGLKLTSSEAHLYVNDRYNQISSGLKLTSSEAHLYVNDKYNQLSSGLKLTSSTAHLYVDDKYAQMTSGLRLTSSTAHLYVDNKYDQMTSGLKLTSSEAHLYVNDRYSQLASGLKMTSSEAHLYVDNKYDQMTSGLKLTSSEAHLYVNDRYSQLASGLKMTSSEAHLYVDNKYTQMSSGLKLTESSARLYVNDKYSQLSSGLRMTSSTIQLSVDRVADRVGTIEGSSLWINRDNINAVAGKYKITKEWAKNADGSWKYDQWGNRVLEDTVTVIDGTNFRVYKDGFASDVVSQNRVLSSINQSGEQVSITASKINLTGYVTATDLQSTNASIDNLKNGNTVATYINAQSVGASGNFYFKGSTIVWKHTKVVTNIDVSASKYYFITGGLDDGKVVNGQRYYGYNLIGYSAETIYYLGANE